MDLGIGPKMRSAAYAHLLQHSIKDTITCFLNFRAGLHGPVERSQDALRGLCGDDDDDDGDDDDDRHHHQPTHQKHHHMFLKIFARG